RGRELAAEHDLEFLLRESERPHEQLERLFLEVAGDALRRHALRSPGVEAVQAGPTGEVIGVRERERLARHDEHLDVRDLVSDAAGPASREADPAHPRRRRAGHALPGSRWPTVPPGRPRGT